MASPSRALTKAISARDTGMICGRLQRTCEETAKGLSAKKQEDATGASTFGISFAFALGNKCSSFPYGTVRRSGGELPIHTMDLLSANSLNPT